jgi:hypothetical protein
VNHGPTPQLRPERLAELLDGAVRHVTAPPDALDRIHRGVRRRRAVRRVGALALTVAMLAGGAATALVVTSGRGPSGLGRPTAALARHRATVGPTPASTMAYDAGAYNAGAPALALAPGSVAVRTVTPSGRSGTWDIDGAGRPATVTIVPVGNPETTFSFLLVVRPTRLGTQTVPFTATSMTDMPPDGPVIVGVADAAHDGRQELFVQVDRGCCTEFWTVFRLVNGHVRQMTMSGQPAQLPVGGSVTDNGGFSCDRPDLAVYGYQPGDEADTFLATRDTYRWAGAALVLVSQQQTTIRGTPADPELAKYSGVSCANLGLAQGEL